MLSISSFHGASEGLTIGKLEGQRSSNAEMKLLDDVHLLNARFKKSNSGLPACSLCTTRSSDPMLLDWYLSAFKLVYSLSEPLHDQRHSQVPLSVQSLGIKWRNSCSSFISHFSTFRVHMQQIVDVLFPLGDFIQAGASCFQRCFTRFSVCDMHCKGTSYENLVRGQQGLVVNNNESLGSTAFIRCQLKKKLEKGSQAVKLRVKAPGPATPVALTDRSSSGLAQHFDKD